MVAWMGRSASVGPLVLALAVLCALLLAVPGVTITTKYLNDLFVILDGAHRMAGGQVPSRDFPTVLGPLAHAIPWAGYALSGTLGGAMPLGMALCILALAPAMAHVMASRLRPVIALPFAAFLLLILAAPVNLGETVTQLSFARYYNRIGWAALATLLVMVLPPAEPRPRSALLDALSAAFLTLVMLATKATYGVAAVAFLLFMLLDRHQRRWAALALGITLLGLLVIEAFWGSTRAHVEDLVAASRVSGGLRGTWGQITDHVLGNFADYVLLGLFAGLALWRTRSLREAVFYLACAVGGFLLINQNFQAWGILTLHAAAAVAAERILRASAANEPIEERWAVSAGAKLLFLALVLPTIAHSVLALGLHASAAVVRAGEEVPLPNAKGVRLAHLWTWSEHDVASAYLATVKEGAEALTGLGPEPRRVLTLDLANPFPAALGWPAPMEALVGLQWERTVDARHFPPADRLFGDADVILEPKPPEPKPEAATEGGTLQDLYRPLLAERFDLVQETQHWRLHRRREPAARTSCADCGPLAVGTPAGAGSR